MGALSETTGVAQTTVARKGIAELMAAQATDRAII